MDTMPSVLYMCIKPCAAPARGGQRRAAVAQLAVHSALQEAALEHTQRALLEGARRPRLHNSPVHALLPLDLHQDL